MSDLTDTAAKFRPAGQTRGARREVLKGLLWREWLAHGERLTMILCIWLLGQWVLLIFSGPWWILGFGALFAVQMGLLLGGGEALEGAEEFAFSLPPTRAQRYLLRLVLGGASITFLVAMGLLAVGLDLPQRLWGLIVESGFTEPFPAAPPYAYALGFSGPVAVFAFSFAMAAVCETRGALYLARLGGAACAAVVAGLGLLCELWLWGHLTGLVSATALLALAPAALLAGYLRYLRKEGISRPAALQAPSRWRIATLGAVAAVALGAAFFGTAAYRATDLEPPTKALNAAVDRTLADEARTSAPAAAAAASRPAGVGPGQSEKE